ncbi:MADS-box transcription factor Map1 [Schizosaccharomyces cryophilus OY26]|uniref:MADS-box transcription factor Map1 n=1 Tax=Schizosaccharomyces cryophilus (strain OY26 / ATCC MYA-4695 / CBS 11777 / NBRC 106824 / NRRL Y48691) TaxID=653667 RepID=S9X8M1_SCHCR|nr:MADS-box transcription factor Map1 [Schizosaccharomyces cryophilus OY26]EPY50171.1 MADS-box transcription factor Map1 [Schizosaccharomyces cryophilus OY26]
MDQNRSLQEDAEGEESSKYEPGVQYIQDPFKRQTSFKKRKAGLFKKANELFMLTGSEVMVIVVSETGLVHTFSTPKLEDVVKSPEGQKVISHSLKGINTDENEEKRVGDKNDQESTPVIHSETESPKDKNSNLDYGLDRNAGNSSGYPTESTTDQFFMSFSPPNEQQVGKEPTMVSPKALPYNSKTYNFSAETKGPSKSQEGYSMPGEETDDSMGFSPGDLQEFSNQLSGLFHEDEQHGNSQYSLQRSDAFPVPVAPGPSSTQKKRRRKSETKPRSSSKSMPMTPEKADLESSSHKQDERLHRERPPLIPLSRLPSLAPLFTETHRADEMRFMNQNYVPPPMMPYPRHPYAQETPAPSYYQVPYDYSFPVEPYDDGYQRPEPHDFSYMPI